MANYSIKDLENFTGIKAHTIRIWEKRYNLVEPKRTCTNIRYYDDDDLKKLLNVSILNRHGFKISNIANFSDSTISEKIYDLSQSENDDISQVESLVVAMIDMDEIKFDKVFNTTVINYGFEETVLKLIYPFFEKVGILWQIGSINPAQEHFISNLIRQKMIMAIDGLMPNITDHSKSFLLFLPEGEYHELGLIFYHYLIKKYDHKVIYLGESVPLEALNEVSKNHKFDYIITSFTTPLPDQTYEESVRKLFNSFEDTVVMLSGMQANKLNDKEFSSVQYLNNALDLRAFLQKL